MITDRNFTPPRLDQYPLTLAPGHAGVGNDVADDAEPVQVRALPAPVSQRSPEAAVVLYSPIAASARRADVETADPRIRYDQIPYANIAGIRFYAATQQIRNRGEFSLCDEFA